MRLQVSRQNRSSPGKTNHYFDSKLLALAAWSHNFPFTIISIVDTWSDFRSDNSISMTGTILVARIAVFDYIFLLLPF